MYESSSLCLWHHVSTSHNYSFAVILMIMLLSFTQANWYRGQWRAKIHIKEGSTFDSPGQNETVSWTNSPTYICLTMPSRDVYISSFKVYFKYELQRCNPREGYFISCCCKVLMTFAMWRWMICNCFLLLLGPLRAVEATASILPQFLSMSVSWKIWDGLDTV